MSETMETQSDDAKMLEAALEELNSPKKSSEENATMPDDLTGLTPAEEISFLNDFTSPIKISQKEDAENDLIENTENDLMENSENDLVENEPTDSTPLEESITPIVDLSGADNTQDKVTESAVSITADQCLSHSKTISDTVQFNREEVVSDSRANALWIVCQVCKSKILQPNTGVYVENEAELPPLLKKESLNAATQEIPVEMVTAFWKIKDMFHFENIGVSKTIGNTKYLLCADCEIGPVGYHLTTNPQAFFLAANRVVYAVNV